MKFKLRNNKEEESTIELWLEEGPNGINLIGRDKRGVERYLMFFRKGRFYRPSGVGLEGLETGLDGKIKEEL